MIVWHNALLSAAVLAVKRRLSQPIDGKTHGSLVLGALKVKLWDGEQSVLTIWVVERVKQFSHNGKIWRLNSVRVLRNLTYLLQHGAINVGGNANLKATIGAVVTACGSVVIAMGEPWEMHRLAPKSVGVSAFNAGCVVAHVEHAWSTERGLVCMLGLTA